MKANKPETIEKILLTALPDEVVAVHPDGSQTAIDRAPMREKAKQELRQLLLAGVPENDCRRCFIDYINKITE